MDIIFVTFTKYLIPLSFLLQKTGARIYYHSLSQSLRGPNNNWPEVLREKNIIPLPIESLPHVSGYSQGHSDPKMAVFETTKKYIPKNFTGVLEKLFRINNDILKKTETVLHVDLAFQMMTVTNQVNIWARANPDRKYLLIDVDFYGFILPELASNVRLLVLPVNFIAEGTTRIMNMFRRIFGSSGRSTQKKVNKDDSQETEPKESAQPRMAFVVHKGLDYGNLFEKNLFYSADRSSDLHPENLIHLDYSGYPSPSPKLKWDHIGSHRQSWIKNIYYSLVAISHGILHIRSFRHIIGLFLIARSYVIFQSFSRSLDKYPSLEMALIDFEILCPKELLLAFEARGIKSVAVQERFILFKNNLIGSTILNYYLCGSRYAADAMEQSPLYCIDHYVPVGQYRSDNLVLERSSPPPDVLKEPVAEGRRIITALGFATALTWYKSQTGIITSWTDHQHFLNEMYRLAGDLPDAFIILRYKDVDWIELPVFAEIVQKIMSSENMTISTDYSRPLVSYDLCAHSDLVIAKHTSLADECLSVGIPVLFHEYSHNGERIVADCFEYSPTGVMCFNYEQLIERARIVLSGTPNGMTQDYDYLKKVVYGGLGDGMVKERVHEYIEGMLSQDQSNRKKT